MSSETKSQLYDMMVQSNNKFALDLYKVLATNNENTFFSPVSVYIALVLVHLGAKESTADELEKYLHLPQKKEDLLGGIILLLEELKNPKLNTATEMFIEESYKVKPEYKENAKKYLNSESRLVNFQTAAKETTKLINQWVSSQTNQKINNLIPEGLLDSCTKLVLVNAIHFKDEWFHKFNARDTYKRDFHVSKEHSVSVDMMHVTKHFSYVEKESFKALQLPYQDDKFKMLILLPNEIDGLSSLEQTLQQTDLLDLLNSMQSVKVNVSLPKFKLEKFINLNEALKKMGIETMFSGRADFSGIHEPNEVGLTVSNVLHKAFVEVNEEGTEAAAATGKLRKYSSSSLNETYYVQVPISVTGTTNI